MNQVELNDQESLRCHIMECKELLPNISNIRIFLNLLSLFQEKYFNMTIIEKVNFLHDLYLISGAE